MKPTTQAILSKVYQNWYNQNDIKYRIIRYTQQRETAILPPKHLQKPHQGKRNLKIHTTQDIDAIKKISNVPKEIPYTNWYYSLAKYHKGIPIIPWGAGRGDAKQKWAEEHENHISKYDMLIDIDGMNHESFEYTKESAIKVQEFLDLTRTPHRIRFSGNGFHFIIPGDRFDPRPHQTFKEGNIYQLYNKIGKYIYDKITELTDHSIYDSRRICKIPYTLAIYENVALVCLPLNKKDLKEFTLAKAYPSRVIKNLQFYDDTLQNPFSNARKLVQMVENAE